MITCFVHDFRGYKSVLPDGTVQVWKECKVCGWLKLMDVCKPSKESHANNQAK